VFKDIKLKLVDACSLLLIDLLGIYLLFLEAFFWDILILKMLSLMV